jgi:hypothetical protein
MLSQMCKFMFGKVPSNLTENNIVMFENSRLKLKKYMY